MPDIERVILLSLVVFRISELFAIDEGPFEIFSKLRGWAMVHHYKFYEGLICRYCNGMWFSFLLVPILSIDTPATNVILYILAASGLQAIFIKLFGRE